MRSPENALAVLVLATVVAAGSVAVAGCGLQAHDCHSGWSQPAQYDGDPHASADQATWTQGMVLEVEGNPSLPPGTLLQAGFTPPGSEEMKPSDDINVLDADPRVTSDILFGGGKDPAKFAVRFHGTGSNACNTPPTILKPIKVTDLKEAKAADLAAQPKWS